MNAKKSLKVVATSLASVWIIAISSCSDSTSRPATGAAILIEPGVRVGKVRAGMPVDEVIAQLGKPDRETGRFLEYRRLGFAVGYGPDKKVSVVMCGGSSGASDALARAFTGRTKEGIGMSSSRADVIKAYGEPPSVDQAPAGQESLKYTSHGLTFTLQDGKVYHMIVDFRTAK